MAQGTCTIPGCDRPTVARGLCSRDYQQARADGTLNELSPNPSGLCQHCEQPIPKGRRWGATFCSRQCQEAARAARQAAQRLTQKEGRACLYCATLLDPAVTGRAKFCSNRCSDNWHNGQRSAATLAHKAAQNRRCRGCDGPIPVERPRGSFYCSVACKKKAQDAKWRAKSPGYMRQYLYGMTEEQYAALLETQDNRCAICRTSDWNGRHKRPHVDHDHTTGTVRGILCHECNIGLGKFKDDPDLLRAALRYLERDPSPFPHDGTDDLGEPGEVGMLGV